MLSAVDEGRALAHVSESVKRDCAPLVVIPPGTTREDEWVLWGRDRQAFVDCRALNAAKGVAIEALERQVAK